MTIHTGHTYLHLPSGLPCTITDVSRVSGRAMGTLSDGRPVHDIPTHDLQDLPTAAPPAPTPPAEPAAEESSEEADAPSGLTTPRRFRERLRGDREPERP